MATLVLTAVGTAIGGPLGGALGALVGQQADRALFGSGAREGPRLKELAVTTSSYGQPMPRHFGRMRVAGTVIWATDLKEVSSTSGGKGKPKTTTYSYSASFAVALSSTPITAVGRIWADGNLLRGTGGDLKVEGAMRLYTGEGDAPVDPLIAADRGDKAPAFRDCAYVVFEDLQLADFGNRIPALTFEILAGADRVALADLVPQARDASPDLALSHTIGFADEGGPLTGTLRAIDAVFPLTCAAGGSGLRLSSAASIPAAIPTLPEQLSQQDSEDASERHRRRAERLGEEPLALRYYDEARDYQPGVQRAIGSRSAGRERMLDMPATMSAAGAKQLANDNAHRARWHHERITWRIGELDPALGPGEAVRLPDQPGVWRIEAWEWHDRGVELTLLRLAPDIAMRGGGDTGVAIPPRDLARSPTHLRLFELPPEDSSVSAARLVFAAATSRSAAWRGAALFGEQGTALVPIGPSNSRRAISGQLAEPLGASPALMFEQAGSAVIELFANDLDLADTSFAGIAAGANRVCIGSEVLQFAQAVPLGEGRWRLAGLLRGRAGTEQYALAGHDAGTLVTMIDDRLTALDPSLVQPNEATRIAAIGRGDDEPVFADLESSGLSRRPPPPAHPRKIVNSNADWTLCWTRRARGEWRWGEGLEVPLVEEREAYLIGLGPVDAPLATWSTSEPEITFSEAERASLLAFHGAAAIWVRQIGTYASSDAIELARLI